MDVAFFMQRTLVLPRPGVDLATVCNALTLQSKNLYNTTHFCVNNALTAYERMYAQNNLQAVQGETELGKASWTLKPELHVHQQTAIDRVNGAVASINAARTDKHNALIEDAWAHPGDEALVVKAKKAKLVLIPALTENMTSVYRTLLDDTVLDNVMRTWPGLDGESVYSRLPAKAAQQVLRRYKAAWSGFFESLKAFNAGGAAMTGRPRQPDYLAKQAHFVLELPLTQIGECLIGLGDRTIPVDFTETVCLTEIQMCAWNGYRIEDAVEQACKKRFQNLSCTAQHLRIVPHKGSVKLEVVVRVARNAPQDSLLARMERDLGEELPASGAKRNKVLTEAVQVIAGELQMAGMDMGVNNTLAIAYAGQDGQHRAQVVSAGRLDRLLGQFDREIDAGLAKLTTPEVRALQARKELLALVEQKLSRSEEMALRKGLKAIHADPGHVLLRSERAQWLKDYLHKLSCGVVGALDQRGVQVLVIGKNKGWKDGMAMGKTQNRRFGRVGIAQLIELITYKAQALGIVVLTTEESYTSKTSFVNNEPLKNYAEEKTKEKTKNKDKSSQGGEAALARDKLILSNEGPGHTAVAHLPNPPMGKRLKNKRHTFVNHNQTGRLAAGLERVHADVNAAFNMLRKVFKNFAYHAGLNLNYTLLRVSARFGLVAIRL